MSSTIHLLKELSNLLASVRSLLTSPQDDITKDYQAYLEACLEAYLSRQLGVAQGFNAQYHEAVGCLRDATNILNVCDLQKAEDDVDKKEVADLKALRAETYFYFGKSLLEFEEKKAKSEESKEAEPSAEAKEVPTEKEATKDEANQDEANKEG